MVYGVYVFPTCPTAPPFRLSQGKLASAALSNQRALSSALRQAKVRRDPIPGPQNQHIQYKNRTKPWYTMVNSVVFNIGGTGFIIVLLRKETERARVFPIPGGYFSV